MATTAPGTRLEGIELVLGRPRHQIDNAQALERLADERILVTGAAGSIGAAVVAALDGLDVTATDIDELDITEPAEVFAAMQTWSPTLILHLAGAKHAPDGEMDPSQTILTNIGGTQNVLDAAYDHAARVVTASTCKACDPETVYGATKLLAERMTLDAGGTVVRFYNVVETSGNVFRAWEALGEFDPVPVTPCARYFITLDEAVALVLHAAGLPSGRYSVDPGVRPRPMPSVAGVLYPDNPQVFIPARRGDRLVEPLHAKSERVRPLNEWLWRVESTHDAQGGVVNEEKREEEDE